MTYLDFVLPNLLLFNLPTTRELIKFALGSSSRLSCDIVQSCFVLLLSQLAFSGSYHRHVRKPFGFKPCLATALCALRFQK